MMLRGFRSPLAYARLAFAVLVLCGAYSGFTPIRVLNPVDFHAFCDGSTDDTTALTAWAAAITAGSTIATPATGCVFKTPIAFPAVNNVRGYNVTLIYAGTSTNVNAVTIGSLSTVSAGWNIDSLTVRSNIVMTGGDGLLIQNVNNMNFTKLNVGGQSGLENGNWYNAVEQFATNSVRVAQMQTRGSHYGYYPHGGLFNEDIDTYIDQLTITASGVGIVAGGALGGLNIIAGDIVGNGENVLIDQEGTYGTIATSAASASGTTITLTSVSGLAAGDSATDLTATGAIPPSTTIASIAANVVTLTNSVTGVGSGDNIQFGVPNHQILLGPHLAVDGTNNTLCVVGGIGTCGTGMEIADIGDTYSPSVLVDDAWHSFAQGACLLVDSQVVSLIGLFDGQFLSTCADGGANGAFDNESASANAFFHLQITGTRFEQNGVADIHNVSGAQPITLQAASFDSAVGVIAGQVAGSRVGNTGGAVVSSAANNVLINAASGHFAILGSGSGSNCNLWAGNGSIIPGGANGVSAGCALSVGTSGFPMSDLYSANLSLTPSTWADTQTCTAGQIAVDGSYIYVCTATNTVKRAALSAF